MKTPITITLSLLLLCGCSPQKPPEEEHNYHEIKDKLIDWNYIFEQEENDYLVYFYSERCGYCNEIKQDIIKFYLAEIIPMYFVCTDFDAVVGPRGDLTGVDNIDDFYIFGTPFLSRLKNHKIANYYVGVSEIRSFISTYKSI